MGWIVRLAEAGAAGPGVDIMEISRPDGLGDIGNLGLTLAEAKQLLAAVQREVAAAQAGSARGPATGLSLPRRGLPCERSP